MRFLIALAVVTAIVGLAALTIGAAFQAWQTDPVRVAERIEATRHEAALNRIAEAQAARDAETWHRFWSVVWPFAALGTIALLVIGVAGAGLWTRDALADRAHKRQYLLAAVPRLPIPRLAAYGRRKASIFLGPRSADGGLTAQTWKSGLSREAR